MATPDIGLPYQIGVASRSSAVSLADLVKVTAALNLQISRDFAPLWGISASVVALANPDSIDPGIWPIFVEDDISADAQGFHQTDQNQPFARVAAGPTWSLTASHECLEMLADPTGNRLYPSVGIELGPDGQFRDTKDKKYEYLVELCDPCEDESLAYMINEVIVADFYTPRYFDPLAVDAVRYSFSGKIKKPRQILSGGYLSWRDPQGGGFKQALNFEKPEIVTIPLPKAKDTGRTTLRGMLDQLSRKFTKSNLASNAPISVTKDERQNWLGVANASRAALYAAAPRLRLQGWAAAGREDIASIIARNRDVFQKTGAMLVRPGWLLRNGWLQPQRSIVVIAAPGNAEAVRAALPATMQGVPVNVRPANPLQVLRHDKPRLYATLASGPRQEYEVPSFPGEIRFGDAETNNTAALLAAARPQKPELAYTRPAGVTLDEITAEMSLTVHASPDAGWAQLKAFFEGIRGDLVVGMYDFTAAHIDEALVMAMKGRELTLTLDHPPGKATREQTIDKTASDIEGIDPEPSFAWALERDDRKAAAWIYPNAYHIKVAVRSDDVMWLSSGNWNTTNQPEIDLSDRAAAIATAKDSDRDWHVIAESPELSHVFRAYLQQDNRVALQHQAVQAGPEAAAQPFDVPPDLLVLEAARPNAPTTFFPPHTVKGRLRVRPLLTPQDYQAPILELINSATTRFWMQTQYIKVSGRDGDEDHDALIAAVAARAQAGVDVRLITSEFQTADLIEKLMDAGIDSSLLRVQPHVHNKGMIVDSKHVVVSSQNWSADGTLRNRDAGIILYDSPEAAQYCERIFLHDWAHMASQAVMH